MKEKMKTPKAKEVYDFRKQIVEPVFGNIKENNGLINFFTRSLNSVRTEFNLACIGHNLQRMESLANNKALIPPS